MQKLWNSLNWQDYAYLNDCEASSAWEQTRNLLYQQANYLEFSFVV